MKTFVKIQSELRNIKKISDKFSTATVGIGEKNKQGVWENVYIPINFYGNLDYDLKEKINYNIVGRLGVSVAYKDIPAKAMIHAEKIETVPQY